MLQDTQTPEGSASEPQAGPAEQTPHPGPGRKKQRPKKTLPTDRIAFPKQLDILRAHAVLSNEGEKPATNVAIGKMIGMTHSTVSLANSFLADVGLLVKSNGSYLPSRSAIEFSRATEWGDEDAAHKLAEPIRGSWFAKAILRSLTFNTTMDEDGALRQLAQEASAGPEYRSQVALLLTYMEAAGLIERDGSHLRKLDLERAATAPPPRPEAQPSTEVTPPSPAPTGTTGSSPQGGIKFQVSVQVDMADMADWEPARITAFFSGMAQVLAAKGDVETPSKEA